MQHPLGWTIYNTYIYIYIMYMHMISMISHIVCEFWYNIYIINIPLGSPIFFGPIAAIQVGWRVWCAIHSVSSSGHHENHGFRWLTSMFECFSSIKLWLSMVFHIFLWSSLTFFLIRRLGRNLQDTSCFFSGPAPLSSSNSSWAWVPRECAIFSSRRRRRPRAHGWDNIWKFL